MELGADAVLVNTALADTPDHGKMAEAFALAVKAGRLAHLAGLRTGPEHRRRIFAVNGVFRVKWHRLPACECRVGTAHRFLLYNDYVSLVPNCAWQ